MLTGLHQGPGQPGHRQAHWPCRPKLLACFCSLEHQWYCSSALQLINGRCIPIFGGPILINNTTFGMLLVFATVLSLHCIDYVVENTPASKATRALNLVHLLIYDLIPIFTLKFIFPMGILEKPRICTMSTSFQEKVLSILHLVRTWFHSLTALPSRFGSAIQQNLKHNTCVYVQRPQLSWPEDEVVSPLWVQTPMNTIVSAVFGGN